jgi:hypothetical protein
MAKHNNRQLGGTSTFGRGLESNRNRTTIVRAWGTRACIVLLEVARVRTRNRNATGSQVRSSHILQNYTLRTTRMTNR